MKLLIFILLFSPLFASALSGEVIVTNIKSKYYRATKNGSAVYYVINAQKSIRNINKQGRFFITEEEAANKFYYQEGTLELYKMRLHFKKAFLYDGNLILKGVHGTIHDKKCQTERLTFLINQRKIEASKITFSTDNKISIKRQYRLPVNAYLYEQ